MSQRIAHHIPLTLFSIHSWLALSPSLIMDMDYFAIHYHDFVFASHALRCILFYNSLAHALAVHLRAIIISRHSRVTTPLAMNTGDGLLAI
jgi:hypothetical protein